MTTYGFVGDLLIRVGVVDASGLARALEVQSQHANNLGRALADLGLADESVVASVIASALSLEYLGEPPAVGQDVAALVPAEFCRKHRAVPLSVQGNLLRLALTDPLNDSVLQDVAFRTGKRVVAVVVTQTCFEQMLRRMYPDVAGSTPYDMLGGVEPGWRSRGLEGARVRPGRPGSARQGYEAAADRAARQPHPQRRRQSRGQRRSRRAERNVPPGPATCRRTAPRSAHRSAPSPGPGHLPSENHFRHGHFRAAEASGRPLPSPLRGAGGSTCGSRRCPRNSARRSSSGS